MRNAFSDFQNKWHVLKALSTTEAA